MKKNLLDMTIAELEETLLTLGEPKFRAKQLFEWLSKGSSFPEMTNLPKSLIEKLKKDFLESGVSIYQCLSSKIDKTKKYLFLLEDGNIIEGVLMNYRYGNTICVSTQVGCRMNCAFCASGLDGLIRNLSAGEILAQVVAVNRDNTLKGERVITNIVLMGSGEPLDNYDNVTKFLRLVSDEYGLNISKRNISLSTCGICDKIKQLADDGFSTTMTISLHASCDEVRQKIMPINNKWKIADIIEAVRYYFDKTGRRIIFEYSIIAGINDSLVYAKQLARLVKGLPCHINLIKLNYVAEKKLKASDNDTTQKFLKTLENEGISATLRRTMGSDIEGACGQLRRKFGGCEKP